MASSMAALTDHKIAQFALQTEGGHKSGGEAGVAGTDGGQRLNYGEKFRCRFAADAATSDLPIQLLIAGCSGRSGGSEKGLPGLSDAGP
jgi:hypothetical protein